MKSVCGIAFSPLFNDDIRVQGTNFHLRLNQIKKKPACTVFNTKQTLIILALNFLKRWNNFRLVYKILLKELHLNAFYGEAFIISNWVLYRECPRKRKRWHTTAKQETVHFLTGKGNDAYPRPNLVTITVFSV